VIDTLCANLADKAMRLIPSRWRNTMPRAGSLHTKDLFAAIAGLAKQPLRRANARLVADLSGQADFVDTRKAGGLHGTYHCLVGGVGVCPDHNDGIVL